ncbi:MAG: hypothetical protein HN337_02850 [Deltaproteobacteria bacterium]|jgi:hypothetical protein|nr:hypothetical protein [Deltaproteobacteria bacterium]
MMKFKSFTFLLIILSTFALQGCGGIENEPSADGDPIYDEEVPGDEAVKDDAELPPSTNTDDKTYDKAPPTTEPEPEVASGGGERSPRIATAEECIERAFESTAIDIGGDLPETPSRYEPSGADWHIRLNKLFSVHDNGFVFMMDKDGSDITTWRVVGDLEGVTVADPESDFIYLGREYPAAILEFNIETGSVTRTFDLAPWMGNSSSQGLEALTFVEIDGHPEGGEFWAGHQGQGKAYVFDLPIASSSSSTTVVHIETHTPVSSRSDMAGLDYSPEYDVVYVIYDSSNKLTIVDTDGVMILDRNLPQRDQEGIAVNDLCDLFIAQDTNKKVWFYEGLLEIAIDKNVVRLLADRVVTVQNDDGSYDWKNDIDDPLTPAETGFQNVTGVSAWGLFGAIDLLDSDDYSDTILDSVNYFDNRIDALLADPSEVNGKLSCPNYTVLSWYLQANPDAILQSRVVSAFNATLNARNDDFGDDSNMRVDGMFNYMMDRRASIPGVIPWDMGLCVEAFHAMSQISGDFSDDYDDSLTLLVNYLENTFLPDYDADTTIQYGDISLGMPLFVIAASQHSDSHTDLINGLATRLEALVDEDGMISNESENTDGLEQPSAYGLMALKQIESDHAQNVQNYLESSVDDQGRIYDPVTYMETYEVEGEVLRALTLR